jgi:hypothetical protein
MISRRGIIRGILLPVIFLIHCGGGSDVGNPDITGYVSFVNGDEASRAMVVLGVDGATGSVDTTYVQPVGDFLLCFKAVSFDTVFCDAHGFFRFDSVAPGDYVLVASKGSKSGMQKIRHSYYQESETQIVLDASVNVTIETFGAGSSDVNFKVAHISGTTFTAGADSQGVFRFRGIPSGDHEIVLYRSDDTYESYAEFTVLPGCSASMVVDPERSSGFWTAKECGPREPLGRPYILWSSPADGAEGMQNVDVGNSVYDIVIQFSHSMDTRSTGKAVKVISSDSLTSIDSLWWEGAGVLYIALCTRDSLGECIEGTPFREGVTYTVVVDTTAKSDLGVNLSYPETLIFRP